MTKLTQGGEEFPKQASRKKKRQMSGRQERHQSKTEHENKSSSPYVGSSVYLHLLFNWDVS